MKDLYLVKYTVRGIKTLDQAVSLSFYKKIISNNPDTQEYNVKGIYGMNGSGKSGIVTSVGIFRNLLTNSDYLNNPIVQKNLDELINKKLGELFIEAEYLLKIENSPVLFRYGVTLIREASGKYVISCEELSSRKAASRNDSMETVFKAVNGEIISVKANKDDELVSMVLKKTVNLLSNASMCALFYEKSLNYVIKNSKEQLNELFAGLILLWALGRKIHVYLDESDDHRDYIMNHSLGYMETPGNPPVADNDLLGYFFKMDSDLLDTISTSANYITKSQYERFEKNVAKLCEFLQIFKPDIKDVEIERKEDHNIYACSLIVVYDSFKIHTEFESTGIKKLIRLFAYLREMVQGGIVFVDEFDSNLHDVYLCALLEYLMEYGKGQLCFTTHNVGPMDILKRHKKSIDFLAADHKIYSWTTNGNYSPSKLYRNGMIEGSPFNVDSTDFIGVFGSEEEES